MSIIDKTLDGVRAVVIPDMHQDVRWVEEIVTREAQPGTYLVFLGDYFDTKSKNAASIGETCEFVMSNLDREHVILLAGNHDLPYWESRRVVRRFSVPRDLLHGCSGFRAAKAKRIHKVISEEFWSRLELFKVVNGWLVSHAGLALDLWPAAPTTDEALRLLAEQEEDAIKHLRVRVHPLLRVGRARGGTEDVGGLTWCDYEEEWPRDEDGTVLPTPMPQIFGHVSGDGARPVANSWCLDGRQTTYGVLEPDGELKVRTAGTR